MTRMQSEKHVQFVLRLLLDMEDDSQCFPGLISEIGWERLSHFCQQNVVSLRLAASLQQRGIVCDKRFLELVEREEERVSEAIQLMGEIEKLSAQNGIESLFPKAFQHYPDMGHDIDLLILDDSEVLDKVLVSELGAERESGSLTHTIAGKKGYAVRRVSTPVEIHHGRVGHMGEHRAFALNMIKRRRQVSIQGVTVSIPTCEDQVIVCVLQRVYSHLSFRISDLLQAFSLLRKEDLDWDAIRSECRRMGISRGLNFWLTCVDEMWREIQIDASIQRKRRLAYNGSIFLFPKRVGFSLYSSKFWSDLLRYRLASCTRLLLIPFLSFLLIPRNMIRLMRDLMTPVRTN